MGTPRDERDRTAETLGIDRDDGVSAVSNALDPAVVPTNVRIRTFRSGDQPAVQDHVQAEDVEEGQHGQGDVIGSSAPTLRGLHLLEVGQQVAVGEHRGPGRAGRAAGEHQHGEVGGLALDGRRRLVRAVDGEYASRARGRGFDFDDLRDYHPGDSIRDIDWKATARRGEPLVRRYLTTRQRSLVAIVDTGTLRPPFIRTAGYGRAENPCLRKNQRAATGSIRPG